MGRFLPLIAGSLLLGSVAADAAPRLAPEERLARALEGRTAGEPVDCIQLRLVRGSRIIDKTAILYDAGGTIYVNRPRNGAESLDSDDTLVTKTHSSQLCSIDVVTLYDTAARTHRGVVFLGPFVPYRKANRGN
jgi:hypothetical protein